MHILKEKNLSPASKLVYIYLTNNSQSNYRLISENCNLSKQTAINSVKELIKQGFIEQTKISDYKNSSVVYRVLK